MWILGRVLETNEIQKGPMSDPVYIAKATVEKVKGVHRRAHLESGVEVEYGVHGPIKKHYKLDSEPDLPLPVDYVVAAAGG